MGAHPGAALCTAGLCCSRHFLLNKSSGSWVEAPVGALLTPDLPSCHLQHLFVTPGEPGRDAPWCGRFGGAGHGFTTVVSFPKGLRTGGRAASLPVVPTLCPTSQSSASSCCSPTKRFECISLHGINLQIPNMLSSWFGLIFLQKEANSVL